MHQISDGWGRGFVFRRSGLADVHQTTPESSSKTLYKGYFGGEMFACQITACLLSAYVWYKHVGRWSNKESFTSCFSQFVGFSYRERKCLRKFPKRNVFLVRWNETIVNAVAAPRSHFESFRPIRVNYYSPIMGETPRTYGGINIKRLHSETVQCFS